MVRRSHPDATVSTRRTEAFTDGVFAIAATLLVLDLTSHTFGEVHSDGERWAALTGGWLLFNFVLSFVLLCLLWMTHVHQFEHVARVDDVMLWLNNFRLMFIVLVPFATNLTTEYPDFLAGRIAMPVTFFFAILLSWMQWQWAMRRRAVMLPDITDEEAQMSARGALSALIVSALVVVLSPFVGSIAFTLFFLEGLLGRALHRGGRMRKAPADG